MSIPLDRLYYYIENIAEQALQDYVVIYRFFPHGSKNILDLNPLRPLDYYSESGRGFQPYPHIFCNDQEPLDYARYEIERNPGMVMPEIQEVIEKNNHILPMYNLRYNGSDIYDKSILLHSEKRSDNINKYQNNYFVTVYYWSHAIIALDWFRFAQHVSQKKQVNKTFLIYNRAWSGTREYRLKFAEHLIRLGLPNNCQTSVSPIEPELGIHYETHKFKNTIWRPTTVLENFFPINCVPSHYSADFDIEDYQSTDIEVVLETLFDDERLHLTEKSLRPIACAQPFILAGTQGSLEYLRSYGFKTFNHVWDERYDECADPEERLIRIADLMRSIANWNPQKREQRMAQAQSIADYNKKHFFSDEFQNLVSNELKNNLTDGLKELVDTNTSQRWFARRKTLGLFDKVKTAMLTDHRQETLSIVKKAREYYLRNLHTK
jgi:hypothetical protein